MGQVVMAASAGRCGTVRDEEIQDKADRLPALPELTWKVGEEADTCEMISSSLPAKGGGDGQAGI